MDAFQIWDKYHPGPEYQELEVRHGNQCKFLRDLSRETQDYRIEKCISSKSP